MKLSELKVGEQAKVLGYEKKEYSYRSQLLSMGLTPGVVFTLRRIAPLGDPVQIELRGFSLVLRKKEADSLLIEKVSP